MPEAKLLELDGVQRIATRRDDRPGVANNLIFSFRLAKRPSSVGTLVLTGPRGFSFSANCLSELRTAASGDEQNTVFGYLPWFTGYDKWEAAAQVRSCTSDGPKVSIFIEQA